MKGVLSCAEAAEALATGARRVPGVEATAFPVADGGEGTAEVLARALGGEWGSATVHDPLGRAVEASFLVLGDGTVVVDSAEAVGLGLVAPAERDPLIASSRGLGELLRAILGRRPRAVVVGLGGTATVDGGAGLLAELPVWPGGVPLQAACDVRAPLLGPRGAAQMFGPQKGAGPDAVLELERRLAADTRLQPVRDLPGSGAGGGLGAALATLGGELCNGGELVLDRIGFDVRAARSALVVTGEGTVDRSTLEGKAPGAVARRCARLGVRCLVFGGRVEGGFVDARPLSGDPLRAREDLLALGEEAASSLLPA